MPQFIRAEVAAPSKLVICDRLITLAQEADRAGCRDTARHLVGLVDTMFAEPTRRQRPTRTKTN